MPKTTETRLGWQCAGKTCYTKTTQLTPSLHLFYIRNHSMSYAARLLGRAIFEPKRKCGDGVSCVVFV